MALGVRTDRLDRAASAPRWIPQRRRDVAGVVTVQGHSGWHDLVDAVKNVVVQCDIDGPEL